MPFEIAWFHGIHQLPLRATPTTLHMPTNGVGPCQKVFRETLPLPIHDLDSETVYCVAAVFDRISLELDLQELTDEDASSIYAELSLAVDKHMERYRAGECGPFDADLLVRHFATIASNRFNGIPSDLPRVILDDLERLLASQDDLQWIFDHMKDGPGKKQFVYGDPSIRAACRELLEKVPTFHIQSREYDQCERSNWDLIGLSPEVRPADAFCIAVDGETWLPLRDDPTQQAQTEWLLFDGRESRVYLYECIKTRGIGKPQRAQIVGTIHNDRTGETRAFEHQEILVPGIDQYEPWTPKGVGVDRTVRVAVTVILLLASGDVLIRPRGDSPGHYDVAMPPDKSVDDVVDAFLDRLRKKRRSQS